MSLCSGVSLCGTPAAATVACLVIARIASADTETGIRSDDWGALRNFRAGRRLH